MIYSNIRHISLPFILFTFLLMGCQSNSTRVSDVDNTADSISTPGENNVLDEDQNNLAANKHEGLTAAQQVRFDNAFSRLLTLIHRVEPHYPIDCKEASVQGTVILEIIIEEDGTVNSDVKVLRGLDCVGMDEAAAGSAFDDGAS